MNSQQNKRVIQQIFDASFRKDWDTVRSFLHEDMCVHEPESVPYSGTRRGIDATIELMKEVYGHWEEHRLEILDFVAEGDTVVLLANFYGRGKYGPQFKMPLAAPWKLRDGKAYEVRPHYFDTKIMYEAHYGPLPKPSDS